jgi:hypothetical protein
VGGEGGGADGAGDLAGAVAWGVWGVWGEAVALRLVILRVCTSRDVCGRKTLSSVFSYSHPYRLLITPSRHPPQPTVVQARQVGQRDARMWHEVIYVTKPLSKGRLVDVHARMAVALHGWFQLLYGTSDCCTAVWVG